MQHTTADWIVITYNLVGSAAAASILLWLASPGLYDVSDFGAVPASEMLLPVLWAISDEVLFFVGHRVLHTPWLYERYHKMHHKFTTTSAWTSFYAHPLDHQFVMWAAFVLPAAMLGGPLGTQCSAATLALFMHGAATTFIGSHHCVDVATHDGGMRPFGTEHLIHHLRFRVNYGNFIFLDWLSGTMRRWSDEETLLANKKSK